MLVRVARKRFGSEKYSLITRTFAVVTRRGLLGLLILRAPARVVLILTKIRTASTVTVFVAAFCSTALTTTGLVPPVLDIAESGVSEMAELENSILSPVILYYLRTPYNRAQPEVMLPEAHSTRNALTTVVLLRV